MPYNPQCSHSGGHHTEGFSMSLLSSIVVLLAGIATANAVSYNLNLAAKTIAPDGFSRSAALVNGQFPAPLLKASKGDSVSINVANHLADPTMRRSTSIVGRSYLVLIYCLKPCLQHWHGIVGVY